MTYEIERRFLVADNGWRSDAIGMHTLCDGIVRFGRGKVRVRMDETHGWVTFKGSRKHNKRREWEIAIPHHQARDLLRLLQPPLLLTKTRHDVPFGDHIWSVDVHIYPFLGLVTAEVELDHPSEQVELPPWTGEEITKSFELGVLGWLKNGRTKLPVMAAGGIPPGPTRSERATSRPQLSRQEG